MAGGTGAGLGTYAAEALRDTFPASFLMNLCIWCELAQPVSAYSICLTRLLLGAAHPL